MWPKGLLTLFASKDFRARGPYEPQTPNRPCRPKNLQKAETIAILGTPGGFRAIRPQTVSVANEATETNAILLTDFGASTGPKPQTPSVANEAAETNAILSAVPGFQSPLLLQAPSFTKHPSSWDERDIANGLAVSEPSEP